MHPRESILSHLRLNIMRYCIPVNILKKWLEITYVNVDENGIVKLDELEKAIRPDTILISIMYANQ